MAVASELPSELVARPLSLVVLTGLDIASNSAHKKIWESFTLNRQYDRISLTFKLVPFDHQFPKCKAKRTNYDWYLPKGILKAQWMYKHLNVVPAAVILFFDLEWDHPKWKEKQGECAAKVQQIRNSLQGRNTRVAVVLIQKNAPIPAGEDTQASERVATLCSACDLSAKSLFVLPFSDHLMGYTIRLENAFHELAQNYYQGEAKRVKSHKEFLNKALHQQFFVRHQFKIAFFSEMRQDSHSALKHYKQAYSLLTEIKPNEMNILEIKIVAGFINYKICHLSFRLSAPLDAISQFRRHVDFFKEKAGNPELAFEHLAWLSKQFSVFGDLFDEAIKNGLTAIQTQHPGFYYQQAANHSVIRRQLSEGLCHHIPPDKVSFNPLEQAGNLEYFGQRPWRQQHQGDKAPDQAKENSGTLALQAQETMVDHCWIIIPLLSNAVAQFKKYKSPRMKRFLMVQMGEEYYHARDYTKALALLGVVTSDYRKEKWWSLLTSVLITSLRCAYLLANIQEYMTICIELMDALHYSDERTRIQMNLIRVISGDSPDHEPGCDIEAIEEAKEHWKALVKQGPHLITIQMANIAAFVECKAIFSSPSASADSYIVLDVYLRTTSPFPIRFNSLSLFFNNQNYNSLCVINGAESNSRGEEASVEEGDLYLEPKKLKKISFTFTPFPEDVGKQVEVSSVVLELGSRQVCCGVLVWSGGGGSVANAAEPSLVNLCENAETLSSDVTEWNRLRILPKLSVIPRNPMLEVNLVHEPPSLVEESYPLKLTIENNENTAITNIKVSVGINSAASTTRVELVWMSLDKPEFEGEDKHSLNFEIPEISDKVEQDLFVRTSQVGKTVLSAKVEYDVSVPVGPTGHIVKCMCSKIISTTIESIQPFSTTCSLVTKEFSILDKIYDGEVFLLLLNVKCASPWPLSIVSSELQLADEIKLEDEEIESQLSGVLLEKDESASDCFCLVSKTNDGLSRAVHLGQLKIEWKRVSQNPPLPSVVTDIDLPSTTIDKIPLAIHTDLPPYGSVRSALPLSYTLFNKTCTVQEVEAKVEQSDYFMFTGSKEIHFSILPSSRHTLDYKLFPLLSGYVSLPRLHLNLPRYQGDVDVLVQKMIPSHVFIKPHGKDMAS